MELIHRGKVRDVYQDGADELVLVASDRVSVYDVVLPTPIPGKGEMLTRLSAWWFDELADQVANHVISTDDVPAELKGRAMRVRKLPIVQVECIARGHITGSGWDAYQRTGAINDVRLPEGLVEAQRLDEAIFTPTTKTPPEEGHDEPMTYQQVVDLVGAELAAQLRDTTLALFEHGRRVAEDRGVILADTKFEFGVGPDGELVLADEALTCDSSRYWALEDYKLGGGVPKSYDKQVVRDYAASTGWDKKPPGPELPDEVVTETRIRYLSLYERITGDPAARAEIERLAQERTQAS